MSTRTLDPLTKHIISRTTHSLVNGFLIDRRSRNLSPNTIQFYQDELSYFIQFLDTMGVGKMGEISTDDIRRYLLALSEHRNEGGCHAAYRAIRAFLNWFHMEFEPDGWNNPIKKVHPPEVHENPMPGISIEHIQKMIRACTTDLAQRDKAILMTLLDTGARASELTQMNFGDLDLQTKAIIIQNGKGNKRRVVFIGKKTMRELRRYLKTRSELYANSPLFTTYEFERLTYSGLRQIIRRRAKDAGIEEPGLHDFRRAFALQCLRNGMDLLTISRLLGHSNLSITQRYICQDDHNLGRAHQIASPVDRMGINI